MKKFTFTLSIVVVLFVGCGGTTPKTKSLDANKTKTEIKKVEVKEIKKDSRYNDKIRNVGRLKKSSKVTKIDSKSGTKTESKNFLKRMRRIGKLQKANEEVKKVK